MTAAARVDPVLSPHDIAAELNVPYERVLTHLRLGELRGVKRGRHWYVRRSALDEFLDPDRPDT